MSLVLIADDEEPTLEILAEVVSALGHQVLCAHDGEEALTLARSHEPDLVITDFMMPRKSGVELIRGLRAVDGELAATPVILISAASPRAAVEATRFLAKPLKLDQLEDEVKDLLAGKTARPLLPVPVSDNAVAPVDAGRRPEPLNWVAHELKSPLSAVRMSAELLRRRLEVIGEEQDRGRVQVMLRGLDRMTDLINSVLDAAALGEGKVTLKRQRVDVTGFVERVVSLWRDLHADVEITLRAATGPLELSIDESRLQQVLDNLLSNAIKYGESKPVEIEVSSQTGHVVISVCDHGRGIAADQLPHLFERFHRAEPTHGQGHGLGLYIAAALTKLHGGTLRAKSEPGAGATFSLMLPTVS